MQLVESHVICWGSVGDLLGTAVDYLNKIGMEQIHAYEEELTAYLFKQLETIPAIRIYGKKLTPEGKGRASLAAFNIPGINANDLATFLDQEGIAIKLLLTHSSSIFLHFCINL